jgi:hypothetical protein
MGASASVSAQEIPLRRAKRVAIWPVQHLDSPCDQLFSMGKRDVAQIRVVAAHLKKTLSETMDVTTISPQEIRRMVTSADSYKDKVVVGRERYHMGHEYYRDLRQSEAIDSLNRGVEVLDDISYDAVEPQAFSEVLFLLGIALVEQGQAAKAHQAFKRALFLSPLTTFSPGFHPKAVEQAMAVACEDLEQSLEKEVPLGTQERTFAFMSRHRLDALVYPLVVMDEGEKVLLLLIYDGKSMTVSMREHIRLADEARAMEAAGRLLSRWSACVPYHQVSQHVEERSKWVFAANYQHLVFLQGPLRSPLWMMGFSFDGAHFFKRFFALGVKAQFLSSLPDRFEDLVDGFTSARLMIGPAFSFSGSWWRVFLATQAEFHYMGAFKVTSNANCKHFMADYAGSSQCPAGAIKEYPVDFLAGINVTMGAQFFVAPEMFLSIGASASTYVAPFDRSFQMNFPIALEAGGGVAF